MTKVTENGVDLSDIAQKAVDQARYVTQ